MIRKPQRKRPVSGRIKGDLLVDWRGNRHSIRTLRANPKAAHEKPPAKD